MPRESYGELKRQRDIAEKACMHWQGQYLVLAKRCEALEQLCCDMYASIKRWWLWIPNAEFSKHSDLMKELGLLEEK